MLNIFPRYSKLNLNDVGCEIRNTGHEAGVQGEPGVQGNPGVHRLDKMNSLQRNPQGDRLCVHAASQLL